MLSALSVAEFCRTEAARLAAISRLRASCRCLSESPADFSRPPAGLALEGFFGTGGACFSSWDKQGEGSRRQEIVRKIGHEIWRYHTCFTPKTISDDDYSSIKTEGKPGKLPG